MRVELSPFVEQDLQNIADYIALHNPMRALSFVEELERAIQHIAENPLVYRLRPDAGRDVRVAIYGRYLILFRVAGDVVFIGRVVNGARDLARL